VTPGQLRHLAAKKDPHRAIRTAKAIQLKPPALAEQTYVKALQRILRELRQDLEAFVKPRLGQVARADADTPFSGQYDIEVIQVLPKMRFKVAKAFDDMSFSVLRKLVRGVTLKDALSARAYSLVEAAREENIRLVEKAGRLYASRVREVFEDPEAVGLRVEQLADRLQKTGDITDSRAELIARDQTLKLSGKVNEIRQTEAGVSRYVWSTSKDDSVRDSHAEKEGQIFEWSAPPQDTGHPGEDFQCRCVAVPVIDELAGL